MQKQLNCNGIFLWKSCVFSLQHQRMNIVSGWGLVCIWTSPYGFNVDTEATTESHLPSPPPDFLNAPLKQSWLRNSNEVLSSDKPFVFINKKLKKEETEGTYCKTFSSLSLVSASVLLLFGAPFYCSWSWTSVKSVPTSFTNGWGVYTEKWWMKTRDCLESRLPPHCSEPGWPWGARAGSLLSPPALQTGLSSKGPEQPTDRGLPCGRLSPLPGATQGKGSAISCLDLGCAAGPMASLFGWILLLTAPLVPSLIKAGSMNLQGRYYYFFFKKTLYIVMLFFLLSMFSVTQAQSNHLSLI